MSFPVSIVMGSYNQIKTLPLLFASLKRQTFQNFELIVADDGSDDETSSFCHQAQHAFPIRWLTQENKGFRKALILNQAIALAQSDYLIFIDGDVVLNKNFIQDHLKFRQKGHFICGRRVDLGMRLSQSLTVADIDQGFCDHLSFKLIWSRLCRDTSSFKRCLRVTHPQWRKIFGYHRPIDLLGSNFSLWKEDLDNIHGFDESFTSYWGEDGDLYIRLRNSGKIPIGGKGIGLQYHIFHPRRSPNLVRIEEYEKKIQTLPLLQGRSRKD